MVGQKLIKKEKYSFFQNRWAVGFHGYIFVYCVNHRASFEVLRDINQKLLESLGTKTIPRVVVGTKTDLGDRFVLFCSQFLLSNQKSL